MMSKLDRIQRKVVQAILRRQTRPMLAERGHLPDLSENTTQLRIRFEEYPMEPEA